jgi:leader peptidase (prepilin peptidase) / N-methyltransferase
MEASQLSPSTEDQLDSARPSWTILAAAFAGACWIGWLVLRDFDAVFSALLAGTVLWVAAVDVSRFEIPDTANIAILVLGVIWSALSMGIDSEVIGELAARILLAAGLLFAVREVYRMVRHVHGLGLGDVKLAGAGAAWLSWPHFVLAVLVAALAGVLLVLIRAVRSGERIQASAAIPFGALLAPAIWASWVVQAAGI